MASSPLHCPADGGFHRDLQQGKKTQAVDFKPFLSFSDLLSAFPFSRSVSSVHLFFSLFHLLLCFRWPAARRNDREGGVAAGERNRGGWPCCWWVSLGL